MARSSGGEFARVDEGRFFLFMKKSSKLESIISTFAGLWPIFLFPEERGAES